MQEGWDLPALVPPPALPVPTTPTTPRGLSLLATLRALPPVVCAREALSPWRTPAPVSGPAGRQGALCGVPRLVEPVAQIDLLALVVRDPTPVPSQVFHPVAGGAERRRPGL